MKQKCISVRFYLENYADRRAWENLQKADTSRNQAIITAINAYFEPDDTKTSELIRKTIQECLQNISITAPLTTNPRSVVSEEENALLDSLDDFL
ncbi:MAG TPA: hypothetical protein DD733_00655 [Clostridiales bacterium]|jgi:hypothetical protein|nr:hypothetical protein [Clostridiales bacterium]